MITFSVLFNDKNAHFWAGKLFFFEIVFLEEIYLHQVVVPTGVATANALDGDLRVGVVVTIVVAHAHQFRMKRTRCSL